MKKIGFILAWFFGVILLLAGITNFFTGLYFTGLLFLGAALLLLPPSWKTISEKMKIEDESDEEKARSIIAFRVATPFLFVMGGAALSEFKGPTSRSLERAPFQIEVEETLDGFRSELRSAKGRENSVAVKNVKDRFDLWRDKLASDQPAVENFYCRLTDIIDGRKIYCAFKNIEYHLQLNTDFTGELAQQRAGDELFFNGTIAGEQHDFWTERGIESPKIDVVEASISF